MKRRNIFWGLILLCAAAILILSNFGILGDINAFSLLLTVVFVYCIFTSLRPLHFGGILFPLAFLCIIYAEPLHLTNITPGPVLGAALLGTIGLSIIFPHKYHQGYWGWRGKHSTVDHLKDADVNCSLSFGESTKYIDTDNFRQASLRCSFGTLKVFFDEAKIIGDEARIYLDHSFGETELYIPREWNVINQLSSSFGDVNEIHRLTYTGNPTVYLTGNVSFGECNIYYV